MMFTDINNCDVNDELTNNFPLLKGNTKQFANDP